MTYSPIFKWRPQSRTSDTWVPIMDPFSITVGVVGLLDVCARLSIKAKHIARTIKNATVVASPRVPAAEEILKSGKVDVFAANKANRIR